VRGARDDLAGRVLVVERARETEIRLVQELAHARLDPDADPRSGVPAREVRDEADRREDDDRRQIRPETRAVAVNRRDRVVDRLPDQDRDRQREPGRRHRAQEADEDQAPLLPPDPEQPDGSREEAEIGRVDLHCAPRSRTTLKARPRRAFAEPYRSSASRRLATYACSAGGPSSAISTAREPTTMPSASSAAALACSGVEIPKPA